MNYYFIFAAGFANDVQRDGEKITGATFDFGKFTKSLTIRSLGGDFPKPELKDDSFASVKTQR